MYIYCNTLIHCIYVYILQYIDTLYKRVAHFEQGGDGQSGNAPVVVRYKVLQVHVTRGDSIGMHHGNTVECLYSRETNCRLWGPQKHLQHWEKSQWVTKGCSQEAKCIYSMHKNKCRVNLHIRYIQYKESSTVWGDTTRYTAHSTRG